MGSINCKNCGTTPREDYNNPVFTVHHVGKYNKLKICQKCYMSILRPITYPAMDQQTPLQNT